MLLPVPESIYPWVIISRTTLSSPCTCSPDLRFHARTAEGSTESRSEPATAGDRSERGEEVRAGRGAGRSLFIASQAPDLRDDLVEGGVFGEHLVGPLSQGPRVPLPVPALGQYQHRDTGPDLAQLPDEVRPVAVGQAQVHDRHVYAVQLAGGPAGRRASLSEPN